jgi:hypothetical protein
MATFQDFIEKKRRDHERAVQRHIERETPTTWRMKLRVRLASKLATDEIELKTSFRKRRVIIRSRLKGQSINQSDWIILLARRFKSIEAAAEFGVALQTAISAIAAVRNIPIDVGADNITTSSTGDVIKAAMAKQGVWLIDDVHGVDVYPDTQPVTILGMEATATTTLQPSRLTAPLERIGSRITKLDDRGRQASLLMNAAFMTPHPVAMLTLGVAAVELLAAGEKWNAAQKAWIKGLRKHLVSSVDVPDAEKPELQQAIDGLNNFGVLGKTRRLLNDLALTALLPRWEALYKKRSRLFHGDGYVPYAELQAMGGEARLLCASVVETYILRLIGPLDGLPTPE